MVRSILTWLHRGFLHHKSPSLAHHQRGGKAICCTAAVRGYCFFSDKALRNNTRLGINTNSSVQSPHVRFSNSNQERSFNFQTQEFQIRVPPWLQLLQNPSSPGTFSTYAETRLRTAHTRSQSLQRGFT